MIGDSFISKSFVCEFCHKPFTITAYPSVFRLKERYYTHTYCSKRCAMLAAREGYRPTQITILASNNHYYVRTKTHPNRNKNDQVPLSHLIVEAHIGRYLLPNEVVHHIDFNPTNDDIGNLRVMDVREHRRLHSLLMPRNRKGQFSPEGAKVTKVTLEE